jgi:hypothetical protein
MSARAAARPAARAAGAAGGSPPAGPPVAAPARPAKRVGLTVPLIGLTVIGLVLLPTTVVLLAGMIPTLVAWIIDREEEKYAPITVGVMNLCGVLPGLLDLWKSGHRLGVATDLLMDPFTLLWAFGAASVGWAIHLGIPPLVGLWHAWRTKTRIDELEDRKSRLVAEWGREITEREPS